MEDHPQILLPLKEAERMPLYSLGGREGTLLASGRYYIAPNAIVVGNVFLEEDTSIWFGVVLRGGDRCRQGCPENRRYPSCP